ncbi:CNTNAP5, partial [Cordylochernes scorpioides]
MVSSFRCANGRCVAIDAYCDYKDDCGDGSDEAKCAHHECRVDEYQCHNGQCIKKSQVCDLIYDCHDKSDEGSCKGSCNPNTTFQCYDGTCIPRYTLCDGHRDCPGKYGEDEKMGCSRRTCQDLYDLDGIRQSGYYYINPDGLEGPLTPFRVYCDMRKDAVWTIVHHDSEEEIYVRSGVDGKGDYKRPIIYDVGEAQLLALVRVSQHCQQYVSWRCQGGAGFGFREEKPTSWWLGGGSTEPRLSWGGGSDRVCRCYPHCLQSRACNCDAVVPFQWSRDDGNITQNLPVNE